MRLGTGRGREPEGDLFLVHYGIYSECIIVSSLWFICPSACRTDSADVGAVLRFHSLVIGFPHSKTCWLLAARNAATRDDLK
jgi:hypothetical protein